MPTVAILSHGDDVHALVVQRKIEERHDARCVLIEGSQLASQGGLSWSLDPDSPTLIPARGGELVEVERLDALWVRRLTLRQRLADGVDPAHASHIDSEMWTSVSGMLVDRFDGAWVSGIAASDTAENKLLQLRAAHRAGLRVPATLVSQDPRRIRAFCAAHPGAIVKPIRPRSGELVGTQVVSDELLAQDDSLALCPAIYQEQIRGTRHLRVVVFGDRCLAGRVETPVLDSRLDGADSFVPHELDETTVASLRDTLRRLDLAMGVFDLKLADRGEPVFLEVNPQGQFLYVEGLTGLPIAASLADFLVAEAQRVLRDRQQRKGDG